MGWARTPTPNDHDDNHRHYDLDNRHDFAGDAGDRERLAGHPNQLDDNPANHDYDKHDDDAVSDDHNHDHPAVHGGDRGPMPTPEVDEGTRRIWSALLFRLLDTFAGEPDHERKAVLFYAGVHKSYERALRDENEREGR